MFKDDGGVKNILALQADGKVLMGANSGQPSNYVSPTPVSTNSPLRFYRARFE